MKKAAAIVMVAVALVVSVTRGEVLCFCDEDPDGCGHACHECCAPVSDGLSAAEDGCLHLDLSTEDLISDAVRVQLPVVCVVQPFFPAQVVQASCTLEVVPHAASPPLGRCRFCSYSIRLFPRS